MAFVPGSQPPAVLTLKANWFAIGREGLVVRTEIAAPALTNAEQLSSLGLDPRQAHYLGQLDGVDCLALDASRVSLREPFEPRGLRALFGSFDEEWLGVAGRAMQVVRFADTHRHCGRCGAPTRPLAAEHGTRCEACELSFYPRISPAVIVLVRRGAQALLARSPRFPEGMYSALAGFVEPGESLEQTLLREVREEVGIQVRGLRYAGSQPWPFPHSLMVAFVAEHESGAISVDGTEIVDAGWFSVDDLPRLPPPVSIARRLIESWIADVNG